MAWSDFWGDVVESTQSGIGEWYENELQDELGLDSEQEDAQRGTSIGSAIPSAGRDQIDHNQQQIGGAGNGLSSQSMLLVGAGLVLAFFAFKAGKA